MAACPAAHIHRHTHTHTRTLTVLPLWACCPTPPLGPITKLFPSVGPVAGSLAKVANEVRARDRSSLNLSADLALLSLWHAQGDRKPPTPLCTPHPGNRAATGKYAMFYPARVHSTNRSQRLAVPSGAKRNLLFPSDNGRKKTRRMCWKR